MPMNFLETRLPPTGFQFVKFVMVGSIAYATDVSVLYLSFNFGFGLYSGRVVSFLLAVTVQWALNRRFTFAYQGTMRPHHQWARSVVFMAAGASVNYGIYALLVSTSDFVAAYPFLGVTAGSIGGLAINFPLSRKFVFHK